jgi:hypothetical protein
MKVLAAATLLVASGLLAAAPPPTPQAPTVRHPATGDDYTTQASEPPLVPEYDPAEAPVPMYAAPPSDEGGLRQCIGADGVPIFTDRRCEDLQATPVQPRPHVGGSIAPPNIYRVRTCARNQDDLLAGVRAALENHDANRLADYYHWAGMDSVEGYRLMDRLDAFSARPIVDVQLVRSAYPDADPNEQSYFDAPPPPPTNVGPDGFPVEAPARRLPRAHLLRVDQMRSDRDAASTVTYFHLLTNAGCWWMRF